MNNNDRIHLIMPMGGGGTRFGNKGFNLPKPLIELQGRPFFFWAVQSIAKFIEIEDLIVVVLREHIDRYDIDKKILELFPTARIQVIPHILDGAVLTCCEGLKIINDDKPILFNDCDHAFISKEFNDYCRKAEFSDIDGALLTFTSDNPAYSYVRFDQSGHIIGTIEKQAVSREAICGAYYFRTKDIFTDAVKKYLEKCSYSEYFVSGVYNEMVDSGAVIDIFHVDEHISFGTPDEYNLALNDTRLGRLIECHI